MITLPTIPELLSRTFQQYKDQSKILLKIVFGYFLVHNLNLISHLPGISNQPWVPIFNLSLFVVSSFLSAWLTVVLVHLITGNNNQLEKNALSNALDQTWSYFLFMIIFTITLLGGLVFFVLPGIIFIIWSSFAAYPLILENKGIIMSLYESKSYFKGRGWALFNRLAVGYFPYILMLFLPWILKFPAENNIFNIGLSLLYSFLIPFEMIYTYLLYRPLRDNESLQIKPSGRYKLILTFLYSIGLLIVTLMGVVYFTN